MDRWMVGWVGGWVGVGVGGCMGGWALNLAGYGWVSVWVLGGL